jgi:hypothetical protein
MSGTLVTEIKQCVQRSKINHGLPLRQNNVNGVYDYGYLYEVSRVAFF